MAELSEFTENNLNEQGFGNLNKEEKSTYALPLRFTPAAGTILVVIGLVLRSPVWLGGLAVVAMSGVLFPNGMLIDLVYNIVVRHLFSAAALPSTPKPRRFSYLLTTTLLTCSALAFYIQRPAAGLILGGIVVVGGTILTTSLWCFGSWWYNLMFRLAPTK